MMHPERRNTARRVVGNSTGEADVERIVFGHEAEAAIDPGCDLVGAVRVQPDHVGAPLEREPDRSRRDRGGKAGSPCLGGV